MKSSETRLFLATGGFGPEIIPPPEFVWDMSMFQTGSPRRQTYPGRDSAMQFLAD